MLTEIRIDGYRSIRDTRMELGPVNVVFGANGTGKTNLYRALHLLQVAAKGELATSLLTEGGMPSVLWAGRWGSKEKRRASIEARFEDLAYAISLGQVGGIGDPFHLDPDVKEETIAVPGARKRDVKIMERAGTSAFLRDLEGARVTYPAQLWSSESFLSQIVDPGRYPVAAEMRLRLLGWRFYHQFRADPAAPVRQSQVGVRTPILSADGHDLAAAILTIAHIGDVEAFDRAIDDAFPGSHVEVGEDDGVRLTVTMTMPGLARPLTAAELSDGTLRYLCLVTALTSPRAPSLLALDEPETSLHESLLEPLGALVRRSAEHSQIWVTTHDRLLADAIARADDARTFEVTREGGKTSVNAC